MNYTFGSHMAMTQDQISRKNIGREAMGLPTLNADGTDPWTAEDYAKFEAGEMPEVKDVKPVAPVEKVDEPPVDDTNPAPSATPKEIEMTDEAVRKYLKEKKGIEVEDFEAFKPKPKEETAEEKEKKRQIKEAQKYTFGVENGYITKELRDEFVKAQSSPTDLVYAAYKQEAKTEDPELDDAEIEAEFRDRFGLNSEENSRAFKRGQKELGVIAEKMIQSKFQKVYDLDRDFDTYENEQTASENHKARILAEAPKYKETVKGIVTKLKKRSYIIGDNEGTYEYEFSDDSLDKAAKILLDPKFVEAQIGRGYSEEGLEKVLNSVLWEQDHTKILSNVAKQYHSSELLKKGAERQGVLPQRDITLQRQVEYRNQKATAMQAQLGMADAEGNLKPEAEIQAMVESN